MKTPICKWVMEGAVGACILASAAAAQSVRIAFIDPLSGPFANIGEMEVRAFQYAIDQVNARGGVLGGAKLELVAFDNKGNPQDSLLALRQASARNSLYHAGQQFFRCARSFGRGLQAQCAQPGSYNPVFELLGARPSSDERAVQFLAFPLRCRCGH